MASSDVPYDPSEIVDLVTKTYELLVRMRYKKRSDLHYAPHDPPIDVAKAESLGCESQVIELMQRLPYFKHRNSEVFFRYGGFADYREVTYLDQIRDPLYLSPDFEKGFHEEGGPYVRPWILPISSIGNRGCVMFFDTKNGHLTVVSQDGSTVDPMLFEKYMAMVEPGAEVDSNSIEHLPSRPAAQFFRDFMMRLHTLEWIPYDGYIIESPEHNTEYPQIECLYQAYGWPCSFDGPAFDAGVKRWEEFIRIQRLSHKQAENHKNQRVAVERHGKIIQNLLARRIGGIWDEDMAKYPKDVAKLECELKEARLCLVRSRNQLEKTEHQIRTRGSEPGEITKAWRLDLENGIEILQRNINSGAATSTTAEENEVRSKEMKERIERLESALANVEALPNTLEKALKPTAGDTHWY